MEILTSQAVLTIFGILAVYFGVKLVAVAFRLWTPRHRSLTLDEAQLKGWRRACALESAGLACLWLGLLLGLTLCPMATPWRWPARRCLRPAKSLI